MFFPTNLLAEETKPNRTKANNTKNSLG